MLREPEWALEPNDCIDPESGSSYFVTQFLGSVEIGCGELASFLRRIAILSGVERAHETVDDVVVGHSAANDFIDESRVSRTGGGEEQPVIFQQPCPFTQRLAPVWPRGQVIQRSKEEDCVVVSIRQRNRKGIALERFSCRLAAAFANSLCGLFHVERNGIDKINLVPAFHQPDSVGSGTTAYVRDATRWRRKVFPEYSPGVFTFPLAACRKTLLFAALVVVVQDLAFHVRIIPRSGAACKFFERSRAIGWLGQPDVPVQLARSTPRFLAGSRGPLVPIGLPKKGGYVMHTYACTGRLPVPIEGTLLWVVKKLASATEPYAITGSITLFLHGVEVRIGDIDVQTTALGAYQVEKLLAEGGEPVTAVCFRESELIRSHYGKLKLGDVEIEIMGQVQHRVAGIGWNEAPNLEEITDHVAYNGVMVPSTTLQHELIAYQEIGRPEKARIIQEFLSQDSR